MIVQIDDCFAELGGFALIDPARLAEAFPSQKTATDLLSLFLSSGAGSLVVETGILLPMLGITPGYYRIILRDQNSPTCVLEPRVQSSGWVLKTDTGELTLCGLGNLANWNPRHVAHRHFTIEPGSYDVSILGRPMDGSEGTEEGLYELLLTRSTGEPRFSASTSESLSLFD